MLITKLKKVYQLIATKTSGKLTKFATVNEVERSLRNLSGNRFKARVTTYLSLFVCFSRTFFLVCVKPDTDV